MTKGAIALTLPGAGFRAIHYRLAPDRLLGADGLNGEDAIGIGGSVVREHGVIHIIDIIFLTKRCMVMSYEISMGWSSMNYTPLTTIENKVLFLRAINSLPPDIKRFEIWPRIVGPCTPIAPSAPRKPNCLT